MSVVKPENREEFKEHILTKLGKGAIQINVTDVQVEIAIEEALKWFGEWHYAGSHHVYIPIQPTEQDIENRYITLSEDIIGVVDVYSMRNQSLVSSYSGLLDGGWDMLMELAYSTSTQGSPLISFVGNIQYYELLQQIITGMTQIRYNYLDNKLYIDAAWSSLGQAFVVDAYAKVDPATTSSIWQDRWLSRYATAKVKEVWGTNLSKYSGMQLPGGITFNGESIKAEGIAEIKEIEANYHEYAPIVRDFIG